MEKKLSIREKVYIWLLIPNAWMHQGFRWTVRYSNWVKRRWYEKGGKKVLEKRRKDEMSRSPFLKMFHNGNDANITYIQGGFDENFKLHYIETRIDLLKAKKKKK